MRNLFDKRSTIKYRCINKKGMIPGCVFSGITIDAFWEKSYNIGLKSHFIHSVGDINIASEVKLFLVMFV